MGGVALFGLGISWRNLSIVGVLFMNGCILGSEIYMHVGTTEVVSVFFFNHYNLKTATKKNSCKHIY